VFYANKITIRFSTLGKGKGALKDTPSKEEDDPYAGFGTEEVAPALQTEDLAYDEGFQVGLKGQTCKKNQIYKVNQKCDKMFSRV
jgi:hypothetical protein